MASIGMNLGKLLGSSSTLNDDDMEISIMVVYNTIADIPATANNGKLIYVNSNNNIYFGLNDKWKKVTLTNATPSVITGIQSSYILAGNPETIVALSNDSDGTPLTWSHTITTGSLTNGGGTTATISSNQNIFVITPTTDPTFAGTFEITFQVTDGINSAVLFTSNVTCNGV